MSEHTIVVSSDEVEQSQCPSEKVNPLVDHDQYLSWEEFTGDHETDTSALSSLISCTDGLRVLAVDDSLVCLRVLVALLHCCKYNVTETTNPVEALQILRERKHEFDIVITDLRMLEMDGLVLLQKISLEMDLPVIMLSADEKHENIMKAIRYGARDYIIKPPQMAQIKNVWQHVVRKRLFGSSNCNRDINNTSSVVQDEKSHPRADESKRKQSDIKGSSGKADEEAVSTLDGGGCNKKRRVNWTADLHNKFIDAIEKIGPNAVPMEILKDMNVPWLTRANVASHLQKFKNALRGQTQQSAPQARNLYSNSMNSATGHNGYQSSLSSTQAAYSMGMMAQPMNLSSPNFSQRHSIYQQNYSTSRISNQHVINHKFPNLAPTVHNILPLQSRNVHPPVPRFNGLNFDMTNSSYSFSQPFSPGNISASACSAVLAYGQNYACLTQDNVYPQLDWTSASDTKTINFDDYPYQTTQMETWNVNNNSFPFETSSLSKNNMNVEVQHFQNATAHEELPMDASLQPINTNLSDEDDNDELNTMVNSFNFEGPPTL